MPRTKRVTKLHGPWNAEYFSNSSSPFCPDKGRRTALTRISGKRGRRTGSKTAPELGEKVSSSNIGDFRNKRYLEKEPTGI